MNRIKELILEQRIRIDIINRIRIENKNKNRIKKQIRYIIAKKKEERKNR